MINSCGEMLCWFLSYIGYLSLIDFFVLMNLQYVKISAKQMKQDGAVKETAMFRNCEHTLTSASPSAPLTQ